MKHPGTASGMRRLNKLIYNRQPALDVLQLQLIQIPEITFFKPLFTATALLRLYHQYQRPVFIQPSITKGSAGRPLIDCFN